MTKSITIRLMASFHPSFLIAVPQLGDPNFFHRIVLILEHNEDGAIGLVINEPTDLDLGTFAGNHELDCHETLLTEPVYKGGPVEPAGGWLIHTDDSATEKQVLLDGLYVSGTQETLKHLLASGYTEMRFLLGYAGWGAGQLDEEMAQGAWLTTEVIPKHIFTTASDHIWKAVLNEMGIDPSQLVLGGGLH